LIDVNCLAAWDATSYSTTDPPCLRRMDSKKHFPERADGEVHDDGEMWSSALFRARGMVGADVMDSLILEAQFMMSTSETFQTATDAVLAADDSVYAGAHHVAVRRVFVWQGLSSELSPPATFSTVLSSQSVDIENSRSAGVYADDLDEVQTFTAAGA